MRRIDGLSQRLEQAVEANIREHPLLVILALLLAAIAIVFLFWVSFSTHIPIASAVTSPPIPLRPAVIDLPPSLPIPTDPTHVTASTIGLDASIENVTLTKKGAMAVPTNTDNVGWFSLGYRPGEVGNAVLTGHVDTLWLRPAVFAKIDQLKIGDEITVTDQKAQKFSFVVRKVVHYNVNELPLETIYGAAPVPQLNLITCSGKWSWKIGTYLERTVVYSSLK